MTNDRQAVPNGSVLAVSSREIPPSRFNARTGAWSMGAARTTEGVVPPTPYKLRLVSWNIWFGTHRWRERLDALLAIVDRWSPDLIGLQEVTPRQLAQILETDWIRSSFVCSDTDGSTLEPHGVLLLSRMPVERLELVSLPSAGNRKLLLADLLLDHDRFRVLAAHLESGREEVTCREIQLGIAQRKLRGSMPGLILGDFNFDPDRHPERSMIDPTLIDCWRALRPHEPGYTLDGSANAMRRWMANSEYAFRSDNVLLWPGDGHGANRWRPGGIRRIGLEAIDAGDRPLYPSDHFGLAAEIVAIGGRAGGVFET